MNKISRNKIEIYIDHDCKEEVRSLADAKGLSTSSYCRMLLRKVLASDATPQKREMSTLNTTNTSFDNKGGAVP